jgi:hypothetical protein
MGGLTNEATGFTQNYQLSWGNGGEGPLRIVVGGNYVDQDPVRSGDRELSRFPEPYDIACGNTCSSFTPNGRFTGSIFGGGAAGRTLIAPVIGRRPTPADFRTFAGAPDRFNFQPFNFLQIPLRRAGAFANVRYELTDAVNLSVKTLYSQRKSKNQAAPLPFGIGPTSGLTPVLSNIVVSASNPFNPFGVDLGGSNNNVNAIFRRFLEGGPRRFNQTVDTYYAVGTLDGKFDIGGRNWFWDLNASYGRNEARQKMFGNINSSLLRQALGPISGCTNPCVPFNLFGGFGSITPEMINFVTFEQNDSSRQTQFDATANLSGTLFDLPGGPLGLAAGVEYRDLKGRFDPDPVVAAGFSSDIPARPTKGSYDVKEAYAELNAPLLSDLPLINLLELNGAVRFSDYSTSGSTTTFKAGVNYKPFQDLRFRATFAEGFRAPFDRRAVRDAIALRRGAGRSLLVSFNQYGTAALSERCRGPGRLRRGRGAGQWQLSAGQRPDFGEHRRQPESRPGNLRKLRGRRRLQPVLAAALLDRGQLVQDQGRRRDPGDPARDDGAQLPADRRSRDLRAGDARQWRADRGRRLPPEHRGDQDQGRRRKPRLARRRDRRRQVRLHLEQHFPAQFRRARARPRPGRSCSAAKEPRSAPPPRPSPNTSRSASSTGTATMSASPSPGRYVSKLRKWAATCSIRFLHRSPAALPGRRGRPVRLRARRQQSVRQTHPGLRDLRVQQLLADRARYPGPLRLRPRQLPDVSRKGRGLLSGSPPAMVAPTAWTGRPRVASAAGSV